MVAETCPLCSGYLVAYEGRLMKCRRCSFIMDRDVAAVLNLQMQGAGFPQRTLNEIIEREKSSKSNESPLIPT
jgi:putative transposase